MSNVQPELIQEAKEKTFSSSRSILRQKYISALKSGKYVQVKRVLRSTYQPRADILEYKNSFCAIGLAFELMGGDWKHTSMVYETVQKAYGLNVRGIVSLNDGGFSFEEIAHEIETRPSIYFENSGEVR